MSEQGQIPRLSSGLSSIGQKTSVGQMGGEVYNKDSVRENYARERDLSKITVIPAAPVPSLFDSHKKQKVAVYCRVSTDGISQTTSFELQRKYYLKYVRKKPEWTLVAMYSDEGITATNTIHRDGLLQMLNDARAGKFDIIVVKNLSRLSRNLMDCMNIIKELRNLPHPVGILFESENMYTLGENMDFTLQILSLVAQEESHKKSEAMNASYKQRFEQGMYMKPDLLGYDRAGVNELVINPEEEKTVRLIFMMYLASVPPATIAEVLTMLERKTHVHKYKDGRTKGGEVKWTAESVKNIMKNERRCGHVLAQKTYTEDYLTHRSVRNDNKLPQYYAIDQHDPIVSPADFLIAQKLMHANHAGWKYGVPTLEIYRKGFLSGFVKTVPNWEGFTSEDYNRACLSACGMSERQLDEIERRIQEHEQQVLLRMQEDLKKQVSWDDDFTLFADEEQKEDETVIPEETVVNYYTQVKAMRKRAATVDMRSICSYDLRACELARAQLFSLAEKAYFTMDRKSVVFNKNCLRQLCEDTKYIEVSYDPVEKLMIITPAEEDSATTLRWITEKNGYVSMRKCGCRGITKAAYDNMGWVEEYKYRIVGNRIDINGMPALVFYMADPIIIVPVKAAEEGDEKENSIVTKETLPQDATDIPTEEHFEDGIVEKNQAKSRAIYFDDFVAKQETAFSVADLGEDKYSPECIKRLLQKNTAPVEGWSYLNGVAKMMSFGFIIFPETWVHSFGTNIYERESVKVERRMAQAAEKESAVPYGWTVGLELPTMETVNAAIEELKAEMHIA